MNAERLFHELSIIHPLSEEFKNALGKEITHLSLPKNYVLLEAHKISDHAYFLDGGSAMSFTFKDGKKQLEWLWQSRQLIVSPKSFFEQVPAKEFIQLLEQSEILCISYASVLRLFESFPEAHFIYRVILNKYYELSRERIREMQNLNGEQRYQKLLKSFYNIEQILPQEQIASYLGMTPQSLSRIKRLMGRN
jgi:CRP-like cAMP-binding protein